MSKEMTAVLFPGQGAYYGRALLDLQERYPEVKSLFGDIDSAARPLVGDQAVDMLFPPRAQEIDDWVQDAPEALQLGIYAASIAVYTVLRKRGLRPDVLVGHSLGEITALVAAGAFSVADGARIVCHRTQVLRETGFGDAYMAVVGTNADKAQRLIDLVGDPHTVIAVENHPTQTALSGSAATLDIVARLAAGLSVGFTRLKSPFPFHSPLLEPAQDRFADRIRAIQQRPLQIPVYSPITGRAYRDDDVLAEILASHLTLRVRFLDSISELAGDGMPVFVESGALDALTKIVRRVAGPSTAAVSTLHPDAGGAAGIARALDYLTELGAVKVPAGAGPQLEQLRAALLPDVPSADFERFWSQRGDQVAGFAWHEYAAWDVPLAAPSAVPAAPSAVPSAPSAVPSAPSAVPAAPSAVPAAPSAVDRDTVLHQLTALYARALEYPAEVFAEDTELEGELGVDSVKQTELLGRVGEQFGLPPRPSDFRPGPYSTLGKIADLVLTTVPSTVLTTVPSTVPSTLPTFTEPAATPATTPAAPAAPAAPAEPAAGGRAEVLGKLVSLYAEALEYPAEVFAEDTELEGELGVDSVKQTELLGRVGEQFGLPPRPSDFRPGPYSTLGKIADLVLSAA
jgi:acyl transferase domain-containing protein